MSVAIIAKAEIDKVYISQSDSFEVLPGKGVRRNVGSKKVPLGNRMLMQEQNVAISELETELRSLELQGKTVTILANDGSAAGLIAAVDIPKESAAQAIEQLKGTKLEVAMLTGDNERTANAIAQQIRHNPSHRECSAIAKGRRYQKVAG